VPFPTPAAAAIRYPVDRRCGEALASQELARDVEDAHAVGGRVAALDALVGHRKLADPAICGHVRSLAD
jgi:hypothetical protein